MTRKILRGLCAVAFACVLLVPGGGDKAWGATVSLEQARLLAENWLAATTPYGQGMVYYTGFPVPSTSSSAFLSLRQDNRTPSAERALADWFLSKPIANAERMAAMRSAGISNAKIVGRSDGTVSRAKGFGLLVELPASEDVMVAAQMSRLGMKGAGAVLEDAASRRWTASLLAPDGRLYDVRTTSGDVLSVTGLRVEPDSADLRVGERVSLKAILSPSNATDKRVSWSVSKPSVVSTDASGNVLALAEGTTRVRATAADGVHSADCTIRVTRPAVLPTALALTPQSLLLTVGGSAALAISFTPPETTERAVTWSTSNPAVATVLGGSVQAVGVGTARITAVSVADAEVWAVCFGPGTEATHHYERTHRDAVDASIRLLAVYLQSEIGKR